MLLQAGAIAGPRSRQEGVEQPPVVLRADRSPPLAWSAPPAGTVEIALICDDPDAPTPEPWVHWVAYGIPAE